MTTKKKQRHRLARLLRGTGAPMAVAAKVARRACAVASPSLYTVGLAAAGCFGSELREELTALVGTEHEHYDPKGVFFAPNEVTNPLGLHTCYPVGTRTVPTYAKGATR